MDLLLLTQSDTLEIEKKKKTNEKNRYAAVGHLSALAWVHDAAVAAVWSDQ